MLGIDSVKYKISINLLAFKTFSVPSIKWLIWDGKGKYMQTQSKWQSTVLQNNHTTPIRSVDG